MNKIIHTAADGSILLKDGNDPTRTLELPAGISGSDYVAACEQFFGPDIIPVPEEVPMYKVRKFLIMQELLSSVEAFLNSLPEPNKSLALTDWNYAPNLVVNSPLAQGAKAALGLTDSQYNDLVTAANNLP